MRIGEAMQLRLPLKGLVQYTPSLKGSTGCRQVPAHKSIGCIVQGLPMLEQNGQQSEPTRTDMLEKDSPKAAPLQPRDRRKRGDGKQESSGHNLGDQKVSTGGAQYTQQSDKQLRERYELTS